MNLLQIKTYPEEVLRMKCQPVKGITEREQTLSRQMLSTMHYFKGVGLAAPQVGIAEQMIVVDIGEGALFLANPEIVHKKGTSMLEEGCLSVPDMQVKVLRSYEIIVKGLNERGAVQEIKAKDFMATVLQHEIDHLEGKLIIDYLPFLKRIDFEMKQKKNPQK